MDVLSKDFCKWIANGVENGIQAKGFVEVIDKPAALALCKITNLTVSDKIDEPTKTELHKIQSEIIEKDWKEGTMLILDLVDKKVDIPKMDDEAEAKLFNGLKFMVDLINFEKAA